MSEQNQMSLWEHIFELRKRVIYVLILFLVSVAAGFYFAPAVINYLKLQEVAQSVDWVVINLTDAFKVYIQFAMSLGIVITFPFALYQIWAFISPGLTPKERKVTLAYIPGGILLFLVGLSFGYFWLFPFVVKFMMGISQQLNAQELYGMKEYFSFLFSLILPFGFLFQMPLLMFFFTRLGLLNPYLLRKIRKYAYFILFVIAAIITPPDILSHLFVTFPLILLYEISIWLSSIAFRKVQASREEEIEQTIE